MFNQMGLHSGELILLALTVALIFLPSVIPSLGNALGRAWDKARGKTPER
jgi:Sec-independent protein translocase protein TatA